MKRTTGIIPDAINCSPLTAYTQIPNYILRSDKISATGKMVLCILLGNKEGWKTHKTTLKEFIKEGNHALNSALTELENLGFLLRVRYRDAETKKWVGSFWAYTDIQGVFNMNNKLNLIQAKGYEAMISEGKQYKKIMSEASHTAMVNTVDPQYGFPRVGNQGVGNSIISPIKIINNNFNTQNNILNKINNTNKRTGAREEEENLETFSNKKHLEQKSIIPKINASMFDLFWKTYPKHSDKGLALSEWISLCSKKDCPTWDVIEKAINAQRETRRWSEGWIPAPKNWLKNRRWLDDPEEMNVVFKKAGITAKTLTKFRKYRNDGTV